MTIRAFAIILLAALAFGGTPAKAFDGRGCFIAPSVQAPANRLILRLDGDLANPSLIQPEKRACFFYGRGLLHHLEGDTVAALTDYTSAIGWMTTFADAHAARGDAEEELGQHDAAMRDYAEAAGLSDNNPNALTLRCWIRALRGRPLGMALEDCNDALKQRPDYADAQLARGLVDFRMANYAAAIADSDDALKQRPHNSAALFIRAAAKSHSSDTQGATADLAAAKRADSRVEETFAIYGVRM